MALGVAAAALAAGVVILLRSGPPWTTPALAAGLLAALLLVAGAAVSRAGGDAGAGAVLGCAALPFAFTAGLLAPLRALPLTHASPVDLLAGFVLLAAAALVAATAIARGLAVFFGVAVAATFGSAGAALAWLWPGLSAAGAAGLVVTPALALTPLIPAVAFRLARLPLPAVPPAPATYVTTPSWTAPGRWPPSRTARTDTGARTCVTGMSWAWTCAAGPPPPTAS